MTYQNIEVKIKEGEQEMILKGQVDNIHEYGNPAVTIFDREGNIGATRTPPYSMKLSKFMEELWTLQSAAYSMKEYRPMNFSLSINVGKDKE